MIFFVHEILILLPPPQIHQSLKASPPFRSKSYYLMEFDKREIEINGVKWRRVKGQRYISNYYDVVDHCEKYPKEELAVYRHILQTDLWAIIYFVMRVGIANHPFVVNAARDLQEGPKSHTLEMYAREHFKSTLLTIAEPIQKILNNPEERIAIFSYSKSAATNFLRSIKFVLEESAFLKACFPDILHLDTSGAKKWSESDGLFIKRRSTAKEPSFAAYGLLEGMPTGAHFTHRVYDDVETADMVYTPEVATRLKEMFDLSQNLGTIDGTHRVVGTPYHHEGLLTYIRGKVKADGVPVYTTRLKPATVDGSANGASVYLPEERMAELRTNRQLFYSQQLCDPTPQGTQKLNWSYIKEVWPTEMPKNLYKFMTIDPAGGRKDRVGDGWAICVCGVDPYMDDIGVSNFYILDLIVEPLTEAEAMSAIVSMYMRSGRVLKVGVEKTGISSAEIHVSNALRARGRVVTLENESLVLLRPAGRSKEQRIDSSISWPLSNGKIHISKAIPNAYRERLKVEMEKYPFWHDDALDAIAYQYDLMKAYRFGKRVGEIEKPKVDAWERIFSAVDDKKKNSWMYV
jgi:hypothetical protein